MLQKCFLCDQPTGKCSEDSLQTESGHGPFCEGCWNESACKSCETIGTVLVKRNSRGEIDYISGKVSGERADCSMCNGMGYKI